MSNITCNQCKESNVIPEGYTQPMIKCRFCGAFIETGIKKDTGPAYQILSSQARSRLKEGESVPLPTNISAEELIAANSTANTIPDPVIAHKEQEIVRPLTASGKPELDKGSLPVSPRVFILDALGEEGLQMVFEMVAGYMAEFDENRRQAKKLRVLQTLMKSRITGNLANKALNFAETSPETQEILRKNYISGIKTGAIIFVAGLFISLGVHFIANPGRGFVLFQLPCAVGLAYAANSGMSLIGLNNEKLQSALIHYLFIGICALLILLYVAWGLMF